jgi:hypothetical protein
MNLRRLALLIIAPALLAACESPARRALEASPDYKVGYNDGCATAGSQGGANPRQDSTVRDEEAYRSNPAYRAGWGSGLTACRPMAAQQSQPGQPGGMPPMPGMPGMGP